jgi:glycosidase
LEERIYQSAVRQGFSTKDVIYLLMPDRFANLIPGQDTFPGMTEPGNRSLPGGRHGGDIGGIMEHLDYIKELGATTIWTTPLLEDNEPTYSYHGYAQSDLYKVDPRYGTNSWFKELVLESHRRGLKVIKDEVPNHWSSKHWMIKDLPTKTWIHQFDQFTRSSYRTSTQMDPYAAPSDHSASADGWFDTSMPDMNQSNPLLLTYLIQNTIWWVEYACLDGLRVDTYSYNDKEAIAAWTKAIMAEYPYLNIVGEVWLHNQAQISYWQKDSKIGALDSYNSGLPAVMDFTLHDAIMQAFNERNQGWDQGMARIYENFVNDFVYEDPNNLLVFMENHDTKRFNEYCPNLADYKLALTLIATTRGIPQIYYGSEIGMKGSKDAGDADIRRDFPGGWDTDTLTAFYAQDDVRKRSKFGRTPEQEAYFQFTKKVLNWRKNQTVIHEGTLVQYVPENNVYVYFRILGEKKIMVVLNNATDAQSIATSRFVDVLDKFSIRAVPLKKEVLSDTFIDMSQKSLTISGKTAWIIEL